MNTAEFDSRLAALPEIQADGGWWNGIRWTFRNQSLESHEPMDRVLQRSTIQATMYVGNAPYIEDEYQALRDSGQFDRWAYAIYNLGTGGAHASSIDARWDPNLIHVAYHLMRWERASGANVGDQPVIVEFGGGYGAMCLVVHRLGYQGRYILVDYPEFLLLQEWYMTQDGNVIPGAVVPEYVDVQDLPSTTGGLLIATYSLDEADDASRWTLWSRIRPDYALVAGLADPKSVLAGSPRLKWRIEDIPQTSSWYAFGRRGKA